VRKDVCGNVEWFKTDLVHKNSWFCVEGLDEKWDDIIRLSIQSAIIFILRVTRWEVDFFHLAEDRDEGQLPAKALMNLGFHTRLETSWMGVTVSRSNSTMRHGVGSSVSRLNKWNDMITYLRSHKVHVSSDAMVRSIRTCDTETYVQERWKIRSMGRRRARVRLRKLYELLNMLD
jgi:hypothetical protein